MVAINGKKQDSDTAVQRVERLKQLTMKPPIFAYSMLSKLQSDLLSARWEGDKFLVDLIARQITNIKTQLYVDTL